MATTRNRRGSVLLMAIGLLAIIAIMASTFLIVSGLDAQEAQTLSVKAQADPVAQGILATVMNAIGYDRHTNVAGNGPYGAVYTAATPALTPYLTDYMDYGDDVAPGLDRWLSRPYDWREKIGLQLSHIDTDTADAGGYNWANYTTPVFNKFNAPTADGSVLDGGFKYVCTDGDKIPDARLFNTKVLCPGPSQGTDANYWAAVRVVDLGGNVCVNTAGGVTVTGTGNSVLNTSYQLVPASPGPAMIDLNSYVGSTAFGALHDAASGVQGRIGDVSNTGGLKPKSMRTYDRYGVQRLLAPLNPSSSTGTTAGYTPFTSGDEMFLMMCDPYVAGSSRYAGRLYELLYATSTLNPLGSSAARSVAEGYLYNTGEPTDEVRRHLTTLSSVGSCVRHAAASDSLDTGGFKYLRALGTITSQNDCMPVYKRMKRMLTELRIGKAGAGEGDVAKIQRKLAAAFVANLWAYQANGLAGAPWEFKPDDDASITAYGLRQDLVITQAFARHRKMTADADADGDWAWGAAVEIANPSPTSANLGEYKLVVMNGTGEVSTFQLTGTLGAPLALATTPPKQVIYSFDSGPKFADAGAPQKFFAVPSIGANWTRDTGNKISFAGGKTVASIELRHSYGSVSVTIDRVTADTKELSYELPDVEKVKKKDGGAPADNASNCRRDDRLKASSGQRQAFYNIALYQQFLTNPPTSNSNTLGLPCVLADNAIKQDGVTVVYSPGIYRPRDLTIQAGDPNATKDPNVLDAYRMTSLGELSNVFMVGPVIDTAVTLPTPQRLGFPQRILRNDLSNILKDLSSRGRLPIRPGSTTPINAALTDSYDLQPALLNKYPWESTGLPPGAPLVYPDVPAGCLFGEFYTRLFQHYARPNEAPRIYGQINVNTAPKDVLMRLPWPSETTKNGLGLKGYTLAYSREDAVNYILAYRDMRAMSRALSPTAGAIPSYLGNRTATGTYVKSAITGLRASAPAPNNSTIRGFLTPGEVAIPLGDYMEYLLTKTPLPTGYTTTDAVRKDIDFPRARNSLYAVIADCLTTRSDVFGVYIHVQHDDAIPARFKWRYMAIVDRSCVVNPKDTPAVLMFTELK